MRIAPATQRAAKALPKACAAAILGVCAGLVPDPAAALEQVRIQLGNIAGDGWRAEQVDLTLDLDGAARIDAARLTLPDPAGPLQGVQLRCRRLNWSAQQVRCANGELRARESLLGGGPMPVSFSYRPDSGKLSVNLRDARFASGRLAVEAHRQEGRWRIRLQGQQLDGATVAGQVPGFALPEGLQLNAALSVDATLRLNDAGLEQITLEARSADAGFAGADGVNAAEGLALQLRLTAEPEDGDWRLRGDLAAARGTLCMGSCWDLPQQPVTLNFDASWRNQAQQVVLHEFRYADPGVLQAAGSARFDLGAETPWQRLELELDSADAGRLYGRYLQPLLIGTVLEKLTVTGSLEAQARRSETGAWSLQADLAQLSFQDQRQRFGLREVTGTLAWHSGPGVRSSRLAWDGGNLYQIPIGASRIHLQTEQDALRLAEPTSIPVFDGSLELARLNLQQPGTDAMRWNVDAVLTPVAMQDFSRAMGWPEMAGRLSGVIPELRYAERQLTVDGVLLIRAFDGEATIRNLRVEDLLGVVPTLNADVRLRNIDLQQLTGTFSFGRIEGRLEGSMLGLILQNWQPVAFDAQFATPEGDNSRHRISQRAVDNLTSLGGGISGALSRSFLRFFDDFSYDRLGLKCRLQNGVCEMGGVAPAPEGYYIVKGGGLPRIDVIGYQRRVDWDVLIKRLATVTSGSGPVIR